MKAFGNILAWVLAVFMAIIFTLAGGVKLIGARAMVQEFAQIGIGQWFRYCTGILEVSGAIGLLLPKYRFWAALQIAAVMAGATTVNILILHQPPLARLTALLLTLALALAWLRRSRL
jgi:putative oxidoreductase